MLKEKADSDLYVTEIEKRGVQDENKSKYICSDRE